MKKIIKWLRDNLDRYLYKCYGLRKEKEYNEKVFKRK